MNEHEVLQIFDKVGAIVTGSHIVYRSGKHGTHYVNKDALYPHTRETSRICRALAEHFADDDVGVVIGPAMGGIILSQWVAHHLSELTGREVLAVFAEKVGGGDTFTIRPSYTKSITGERVLVVEDVLTTGGSAKKVVEITRVYGGHVVGVGTLWNRGRVTTEHVADVPKITALVSMTLDDYDEGTFTLREGNVPINTDLGKGREFLAKKI
jgi:orotate phosphoribosyltransferase